VSEWFEDAGYFVNAVAIPHVFVARHVGQKLLSALLAVFVARHLALQE